jgi:exodeoxyribonuclease-3
MRVTTFNCNGIRAAARKGFFAWLRAQSPDFVCLQETKAQEHQLPPEALDLDEYHAVFADAQKKGYSGVGIYSKTKPDEVERGLGMSDLDHEGRFIRADFGTLTVASLYVPSGVSGWERQEVKKRFYERFLPILSSWRSDGRSYILCGDFNVAHQTIDVYDPVRLAHTTGFLPYERAWLDTIVDGLGFVDAFRAVDRSAKRFTWWSNRPEAFERNLGWRLDYQFVTPDLAPLVQHASIERDERFSDHAPVTIEYDL